MPQEIHLTEPREKIIQEISAYAGRQLIVRSRDPFLAQIDRVAFCARVSSLLEAWQRGHRSQLLALSS